MGQDSQVPLKTAPVITDPQRCSGCGRCITACPEKLYTLELNSLRKISHNKNPQKCALCGRCLRACPLGIINPSVKH